MGKLRTKHTSKKSMTKRTNKAGLTKRKTQKRRQKGGFIFGGSKKKKQEFKTSMNNFCKVTRDGNNIPRGQKITRKLVNEVCSKFYELEDNKGLIGRMTGFAVGIAKKPVNLAKGLYGKISSSAENVATTKNRAAPLK
jgi:hypothetical protein